MQTLSLFSKKYPYFNPREGFWALLNTPHPPPSSARNSGSDSYFTLKNFVLNKRLSSPLDFPLTFCEVCVDILRQHIFNYQFIQNLDPFCQFLKEHKLNGKLNNIAKTSKKDYLIESYKQLFEAKVRTPFFFVLKSRYDWSKIVVWLRVKSFNLLAL